MAFEAALDPDLHIFRVDHLQVERFLVRPIARGVWSQPSGSGTVAAFASDTIADVEAGSTFIHWGVGSVTIQTNRLCLRLVDPEIPGNLLGAGFEKNGVCLCVFILGRPQVVLVLIDLSTRFRPHGAMA